jgi:hypothetical protein
MLVNNPNQQALSFLMTVWVENQSAFYGAYATKVTLFALILLFKLNNPQLNQIQVKGKQKSVFLFPNFSQPFCA